MVDPPSAQLRVVLPKPGFFLVDTRMSVTVDGWAIYDGSFLAGMDVCVPTARGVHRVVVGLQALGTVWRTREYTIAVEPPGLTIVLEYSRFWGNFGEMPKVLRW